MDRTINVHRLNRLLAWLIVILPLAHSFMALPKWPSLVAGTVMTLVHGLLSHSLHAHAKSGDTNSRERFIDNCWKLLALTKLLWTLAALLVLAFFWTRVTADSLVTALVGFAMCLAILVLILVGLRWQLRAITHLMGATRYALMRVSALRKRRYLLIAMGVFASFGYYMSFYVSLISP